MRRYALLGLVALLAVPAAPAQAGNGIDLGTIVGAGLGGVIGNQIGKGTGNTVATVAGVLIGGVAGHAVNNNWDNRGYRGGYQNNGYQRSNVVYYDAPQPVTYYQQTYVAPPAPPPSVIYTQSYYEQDYYGRHHGPQWQRPVVRQVQQVNYVPVVQQEPVQANNYCREYTNRVVIGNRVQESYGTACLQPDGSWRVIQ